MQVAKPFPSNQKNFQIQNEIISSDPNFFSLSDKYSQLRSQFFEEDPPSQKFQCIICYKPTLMCCSSCKSVFYCDASHQQQHWKTHQFECLGELIISEKSNEDGTARPETPSVSTISPVRDTRGRYYETLKEDSAQKQLIVDKVETKKEKEVQVKLAESLSQKLVSTRKDSEEKEKETKKETQIEERKIKLLEALHHYASCQYQAAALKAKRVYQISKTMLDQGEVENYDQFISDGLLFVKCLLNSDKISNSREILLEVWAVVKKEFSEERISYSRDKSPQSKIKLALLKKDVESFMYDEMLSHDQKQEINQYYLLFCRNSNFKRQIQKLTSLFSCIGSLFSSLGDFVNWEMAYAKYVKVIENNFGKGSLEASNAYFFIGTFYLENNYYIKSMACLVQALTIRQNKFNGDENESIADCYYNIAIVYKKTNETAKALQVLHRAIKIRANIIGEISLPVAQALELVGKIHMENGEYKEAFLRFQDCLVIRKKILHDSTHPELSRIKLLVQDLYQNVQYILNSNSQVLLRKKEMCLEVKTRMEQLPLFAGIISKNIASSRELSPSKANKHPAKSLPLTSKTESERNMEVSPELRTKVPPVKRFEIDRNSKMDISERNNYLPTQASSQDSADRNLFALREKQIGSRNIEKGLLTQEYDKCLKKENSIFNEYLEESSDNNTLSIRRDIDSQHFLEPFNLSVNQAVKWEPYKKSFQIKTDHTSPNGITLTAKDFYPFRKEAQSSSLPLLPKTDLDC